MKKLVALAALLAVAPQHALAQDAAAATPAAASERPRPPEFPTSAFAARSQLSGAKISPDGTRLASRANADGTEYVLLFDAATGSPTGRVPLGKSNRISWLRWAGNDKILLSAAAFDEYNRYFTRLFVLDLAQKNIFPVGERNDVFDGDNVIFVDEAGTYALVSLQRNLRHYPSVYRYELTQDGKREEILDAKTGVWDWMTDRDGVVRIGSSVRYGNFRLYYRPGADGDLKVVEKFDVETLRKPNGKLRYLEFLGVPPGTDIGYILSEDENGRVALRTYDYAQAKVLDTLYENPDHDIESVGFGRDGKPIWVSWTADREEIVWLNPDMAKLQARLERALEEGQVRIVSRSLDNNRMIISAGDAGDPGALYMFDQAAKSLNALGEAKPGLDFQQLATPEPVEYTARDGTTIHAYLTLPVGRPAKDLPLIIMPHGGPYGVRDSLVYDDWVQLLANRGYAVIQPNYRGSGGYGEAFFDLGIGQIGRGMQDDLDDAMDWLVGKGIADPARVCLVGGSYGGYAALWGVTRNPERYRCAASWAGVVDWDSMLRYDSQFFNRAVTKRWRDRFEGSDKFDLKDVSPLENVDKIKRPILLAHGTDDGIVNVGQYHQLRRALEERKADLTTLLIEGEGHSLYFDGSEQQWFDALVAFLAKNNPADE